MSTQTLSTLQDYQSVVNQYDNFLFDCDGVIWEGDNIIGQSRQTLDYLRKQGKRIFFVTNNATKSRQSNKTKFDKMGIHAEVDEIFTSAYAAAAYLKHVLEFPEDKKAYVIGEKGLEEELDAVGIKHSGGTDPDDNVFVDLMDFSSIVADPEVGAVVCGLDMHINYKKIAKAHRYLKENEGCLFIATNLDSTFPTHGSVYPGAGSTIAPLTCCLGRDPLVIGKPENAMLESILTSFGLEKSKTIMVGDRLDTDIKFGVQGGIDTLMVLTGVNKTEDYEREGAVARPTFVVEGLGDFAVLGQ
ncbi:4-nitrophenylphosphatase [Sporobolomyces salmoneus]|uniref:4-nitrophenylphosphatase n=1 Tax=Sporobolomyces salmoneus TaxID=183962 RepID=UPI00316C8E27